MAIVGVDDSSLQADLQPKFVGLVWGFPAVVSSSDDPGKLSQWLCHDENTV